MNHARYAHDAAYSRIATSFLCLGLVYVNQGKLEEPLSMDQVSLQMKRSIHGHDKAYLEIMVSLRTSRWYTRTKKNS